MAENSGTMANMKNICSIVEERDRKIKEADIKIEYYKNHLEKVLDEIKNLEKEEKKIEEEDHFICEQIEQLQKITTSVEAGQEIAMQSLKNHQHFQQIADKQLKAMESETERVEQECRNLITEAKEKLERNPLCQELERHKIQFLKANIERKDLIIKIRLRKRINAQKAEFKKKVFYNFFIEMAENYLIQKRSEELEKFKIEELEAVKRLFAAQEEQKLKQKLGIRRDKTKRMSNVTFGLQECHRDNLQNKIVVPLHQKKEQRLLNEKLNTLFMQDETKNVVPSPKINILEQKVIMPAFVAPNFIPSEKRKNKTIDLSRKWQKLLKSPRGTTGVRCPSQRSENQLSQFSQESRQSQPESQPSQLESQPSQPESQPSQPEALTPETLAANNQQPLIQLQDRQGILIKMEENVQTHYQMVESVKARAEQFKREYSPTPSPALQGYSVPRAETIQGRTSSTSDMLYAGPNVPAPKREIVPKTAVSEQNKCVRFNLEPTNQTETKTMFCGQSMFGNLFNPFGHRATNENENMIQQQTTDANNITFNVSLPEPPGENSPVGLDIDNGENSHIRSPEYSYELEEDRQQTFKPPEMPSFGGGFFSFGKNMFKPL